MNVWRTIVASITIAIAAGCATPTPYHPADPQFGYSEQQLEANRFRVSFEGNALTDRETVENYLLYRAAEITLAQGYDYFILARQDIEPQMEVFYTRFWDYPSRWYGYYGYYPGPADVRAETRTRYLAVATILMYGGKPPDDARAFDARELKRFLGPTIVRPEAPALTDRDPAVTGE